MGTQLLLKGAHTQFSAHVYCGQTAKWIKMPLGTEIGLGLGHIVLDKDPAPPQKGHSPLNFRPMSVVAKRSPISATAEHFFLNFEALSYRQRVHKYTKSNRLFPVNSLHVMTKSSVTAGGPREALCQMISCHL